MATWIEMDDRTNYTVESDDGPARRGVMMTECSRCEGSGVDPRSLPAIPASHYQPAEGGSPCRMCRGSGEMSAECDDCGEPATETSADGHRWCEVCAAEIALAAERLLETVRAALSRSPRIAVEMARARGVMVDAANDVEVTR